MLQIPLMKTVLFFGLACRIDLKTDYDRETRERQNYYSAVIRSGNKKLRVLFRERVHAGNDRSRFVECRLN